MSDKARLSAYNNLKRIILSGAYSNLLTKHDGLSRLDRAFAESLTLGVIERKITLEFILSEFVNDNTDTDIKVLLMTGVYQLFYMDKVPESAAVNETVSIASELFGKKKGGFVNAVMRNICRSRSEICKKLRQADEYIQYSVNKDLFDLIKNQYPDRYQSIFDAFLGKKIDFLRVNTLKSTAKEVASKTGGDVISYKTVMCHSLASVLPMLDDGEFFIQGLASQKAVEALDAQANQTVIDVCACPGGKTLGAAIDMQNKGRIYSFDLHKNKLPLISKSASILGIDIIITEQQDARTAKSELIESADRVICDVPCSGTGVMGSKPEIKYKSPEDFKGLYNTQKAIIIAASKYLKIGGIMVYSTCSINKLENECVVDEFLKSNPHFSLIDERTYLPCEETCEGFYTANLIREK